MTLIILYYSETVTYFYPARVHACTARGKRFCLSFVSIKINVGSKGIKMV